MPCTPSRGEGGDGGYLHAVGAAVGGAGGGYHEQGCEVGGALAGCLVFEAEQGIKVGGNGIASRGMADVYNAF